MWLEREAAHTVRGDVRVFECLLLGHVVRNVSASFK